MVFFSCAVAMPTASLSDASDGLVRQTGALYSREYLIPSPRYRLQQLLLSEALLALAALASSTLPSIAPFFSQH